MSKSQETYNKKQREKNRANKKKRKEEKRNLKKDGEKKGLEIDWSSAPENKTLSQQELKEKKNIQKNSTNNK